MFYYLMTKIIKAIKSVCLYMFMHVRVLCCMLYPHGRI